MKKFISVLVLGLLVVGISPVSSYADDEWGWFAAGAAACIVTGAIASDAAYHHTHYSGCGHYDYYGSYYHSHYPGCGHYTVTHHSHYPGCGHYGYSHTHHHGCGHDYWY